VAVDSAGRELVSTDPADPNSVWATRAIIDDFLFGVSCPTTSLCAVTGDHDVTTFDPASSAASPVITLDQEPSFLRAISCASTTFCLATATGGIAFNGVPPLPPVSTIRARLVAVLAPVRGPSELARLRRSGRLRVLLDAPGAGHVTISWLTSTGRRGPQLSATGTATIDGPGNTSVTIVLTREGRKRFDSNSKITVTAKATFTPAAKTPITALRAFTLRYR
jgi:hypothetical protein